MATLDPGFITNPFPSMNELLAPQQMALTRQRVGMEQQQNALAMDATRQQMGRQAEVDSREHVAQAAGYLLTVPQEQRPAAYKSLLDWSRANGHPLPNAPAEYPGDQYMQMLQAQGISAEQHYKMGVNRAGVEAAWPGGGAPSATGGASSGGTASVAPYVPRNLPQGVSPDEDATVRTLIGEAGGEGAVGQRAVAHVINNRAVASGMSPLAVTQAPGQFEPWGNPATRAKLEAIDPASPQYQQALALIRNAGDDPTGGATHFYAPKLQASLGRDAPVWASGTPTVIGGHNFYKVGYQGGGQGVAARTGGVDYAGPGAPGGGTAQPTATAPAPGDYTPGQRQQLDAMRANPGAYTGRDILAAREKFDDDNRQAAQHAFEQARQTAADARQAAEDKRKADERAKTEAEPLFQGQGTDIQDFHILRYSNPKSEEFHQAYARQANPKVGESGVMVYPNMSAYRMPQDSDGAPITTYDQPRFAIGPGGVAELRKLETQASALTASLDDFAATAKKAGAGERLATVAGASTDLRSAWTNAGLMAKGEALFNLGVLSGPDMTVIRGALADPSTFWGATASGETIDKQVGRIKRLLETRIDQARRSYGGGMSTGGPSTPGAAAPADKGSRPPLSSFGG